MDPFVERGNFRGWDAVTLHNGLVSLTAVPDIGGRIMAYDLADYPYIFVDPDLAGKLFSPEENAGDGSLAAWKNYGGDKTWPSPQGWDSEDEWHGPPDPVLDTGRYTLARCEASGREAVIEMVSPPDLRTGLQISRTVRLQPESTRACLNLTFTNSSNRTVRWSIWDVLQLRAERRLPGGRLAPETSCTVTAPLNPSSRFPGGFRVMFGALDNPQWGTEPGRGLFVGRYAWEIGKVGLDSPGGWIAFSNAATGYAFAERFPFEVGAEYPDGGASVECWTVGRGKVANLDYEQTQIYLMETEVLSPLYTFQPGEQRSFSIQWGACRCLGPVAQVTEAGCVGSALMMEPDGAALRLTGTFGVFDPGELRLAWLDMKGHPLRSDSLGPATPLQRISLDGIYSPPAGTARLELQSIAAYDGAVRPLDSLTFEESR